MFRHKAFTFRQGIGYLNQVLVSRLDVKYEVSVTRIERNMNNQGVTVHCFENGETTTRIADIIVCATEGAKIKDLVTNKSPEEEDFAGKVRYNSLGIVYHVLKNSAEHGLTFYTQDHSSPLAILESVPERNNKPHLFCELAPETVKNVEEAGWQDIMDEMIIEDSRALYPALDSELDYSVNQWIEHMLPVFYPGYITHLDKLSVYQSSTPNSVYYCGDYMAQALVGSLTDEYWRVGCSTIWGTRDILAAVFTLPRSPRVARLSRGFYSLNPPRTG
jgi:oxygen-dependent protoporphyrinogen oxidase